MYNVLTNDTLEKSQGFSYHISEYKLYIGKKMIRHNNKRSTIIGTCYSKAVISMLSKTILKVSVFAYENPNNLTQKIPIELLII